jgi:hypothetical protein
MFGRLPHCYILSLSQSNISDLLSPPYQAAQAQSSGSHHLVLLRSFFTSSRKLNRTAFGIPRGSPVRFSPQIVLYLPTASGAYPTPDSSPRNDPALRSTTASHKRAHTSQSPRRSRSTSSVAFLKVGWRERRECLKAAVLGWHIGDAHMSKPQTLFPATPSSLVHLSVIVCPKLANDAMHLPPFHTRSSST